MTEQKPLLRQLSKRGFSKVYDVVCLFMSCRTMEAKSGDAYCSCSISRTMLMSRKTEIGKSQSGNRWSYWIWTAWLWQGTAFDLTAVIIWQKLYQLRWYWPLGWEHYYKMLKYNSMACMDILEICQSPWHIESRDAPPAWFDFISDWHDPRCYQDFQRRPRECARINKLVTETSEGSD